MLATAAEQAQLAFNPVICAEVSVGSATIEDVELALPRRCLARLALPWEAGFLAGQMHHEYRRRGGVRTSPLPEFFIGAHAAVAGLTLLTRDARRCRAYCPKPKIIAP